MNPKQPVALPRAKLIARVQQSTLQTLERERKRRGMGLGALLDWLAAPLTRDNPLAALKGEDHSNDDLNLPHTY